MYVAERAAHSGLQHALSLGPEGVVAALAAAVNDSSGAGRPTAPRWRACAEARADEKHAVCNAMDPDPRAPIARILLASDPHPFSKGC